MDADAPIEPALPTFVSSGLTSPSERRVLVALCLSTFVTALLSIAPAPFFPRIAQDLQVSVPLLGQVMTTLLLLSSLFALVAGPLADRSGSRLLILAGLVAAAVCLFTFGIAPTFLALLLASVAGAVATAAVLGPSFAMASTAFAGTAARRAVGWTSGAQAGAAIVGVPALAAIGTAAGWRVAFVVAGLVAVAVAALALCWLPYDRHRSADRLRLHAILAPYRPLLRHAMMRQLYGATMLGAVCWYGLLTYLGAFLAETFGMGTGDIGLVYMAGGSAYFLGSLAVGGPLASIPARRLVVAGYGAMAILMALAFTARLGATGSIVLIVGAALAMGLDVVGTITWLSAETPSGSGTTLTLNTALFKLGAAGGGALGGVLLAGAGYAALALGLPLFGLAAACLSLRPASLPSAGAQRTSTGGGSPTR